MPSPSTRISERRSEHLLNDLLDTQGWDRRRPPLGDVVFQHEYRAFPRIALTLRGASKTGTGFGVPEALILDKVSHSPLAVIEAKSSSADVVLAIREAESYAAAFVAEGHCPIAIGLAGSDGDFVLRVHKWDGSVWRPVTYDGRPIGWIPTKTDITRVALATTPPELRPSIPPPEVLLARADEMNRLLRESSIKDEYRPAVVAAVMLALWQTGKAGSSIRRDRENILRDINTACKAAFVRAGKPRLASSIRVDEANEKLRANAKRIATILERLNVAVLTAEHDYLGQLYEEFFRYTGGNTIGQYFTPRHIARAMADFCDVGVSDTILDPACGTGGFLVACMNRMLDLHGLKREQMVSVVASHLVGFESEPVTAALCVANMILRGDGSTGIHQEDAFTSTNFPTSSATVALLNPPFPHKDTDTPAEDFVDRALQALAPRGRLAAILPTSILAKRSKAGWREGVLRHNRLVAVCQLPDDLFLPFAAATTSIVVIEKGVPHHTKMKTAFVRLHHDGLVLKKNARVRRPSEPDQTADAVDAVTNKTQTDGFSTAVSIQGRAEWSVGAYIEAATPDDSELKDAVDVLLRRLASFYTRYAREIVDQRNAIALGDLIVSPYRTMLSRARLSNAAALPRLSGTIGGVFDIFYGMKELHSREGMVPGTALIISPTESYNGCYGWLSFDRLIEAPFVTVAQTGSIGEAFVQLEPCAVNDDCLVLLPKTEATVADLVIAAATLHAEKWRFSYGRKLTPERIASFKLPHSPLIKAWVSARVAITEGVIEASLAPYL